MVEIASLEQMPVKDMSYSMIRLDKSRRRDKAVSFFLSFFLHAFIFTLVGFSFIKSSEFGVDKGQGGIEVTLVASPMERFESIAVPVQELPTLKPEEPILVPQSASKPPEPIKEKEHPSVLDQQKVLGQDKVSFQSTSGAISQARPDYFQNPAPEYPLEARQKGWEGTVLFKILVSKHGEPLSVAIEQSSGYALLDQTAFKAIKKWKFKPAQLGSIPVESSVRIPVRFDLQNL